MAHAEQAAQVPPASTRRIEASRPRIYFGWWIVIGAIVAQFMAMGQNQLTNLILGPMTQELGWTRSEFIRPTTLGVVLSGALGFVVGAQVDRRGARPLLIAGTVLSSAALILTAYVQELWQFWVLRGVVLVLGNVMIGNLVVNVTISKWFVDRRGWAIAMAALGVSGWSVVGTQVMRFVIDEYGWRAGWTTLGFATWLLLPVAMVMKRQPEDHGWLPDGRRPEDADTAGGRASIQRAQADFQNSLTRGEAARTPALWLLVLAFGMALTGMTALFAHLIQFFADAGFTRTEAAYFYSTQGLFSLLAKFVWGAAMQRVPAKLLVATSFSMAGVATLGLVYTVSSAPWQVVAGFSALWGLSTGGMIPLSEFVWASYFGRRHIGAVRGLGLPFTVMLTAGGPLFASEVFDRTGSYNLAMVIFAGMWFTGAALILMAPRPRPSALQTVPLAHRLRQPEPGRAPAPPHAAMNATLAPAFAPASVADPAAPTAGSVGAIAEPPAALPTAPRSEQAATVATPSSDSGLPLPDVPAEAPRAAIEEAPPRHGPRRPARSYMNGASPLAGSTPPDAPREEAASPQLAASEEAAVPQPALAGPAVAVHPVPQPRDTTPRALRRPEPRPLVRPAASHQPAWVPRTTGEAVLAGVVTSLVATAALWFLTRPGDRPRS